MKIDQDEILHAGEIFREGFFGQDEMSCYFETISAVAYDRLPSQIDYCGGKFELRGHVDNRGRKELSASVSVDW